MLKKSVLVASMVAFAAFAAPAASQSTSRTTFGILLGGNAAKITDLDLSGGVDEISGDAKNKYGFQIGAFLNRKFNDRLSFQPELQYIQKGTGIDISGAGEVGDFTLKLSYVELPVLLRADFGKPEGWRPFITLGPTFAFRTSCGAEISAGGASVEVDCDEFDEGEDTFESTDIGMSAGLGLAGATAKHPVFLQLRYGLGFTSIAKDAGDRSPKNSVISLVIGIGR